MLEGVRIALDGRLVGRANAVGFGADNIGSVVTGAGGLTVSVAVIAAVGWAVTVADGEGTGVVDAAASLDETAGLAELAVLTATPARPAPKAAVVTFACSGLPAAFATGDSATALAVASGAAAFGPEPAPGALLEPAPLLAGRAAIVLELGLDALGFDVDAPGFVEGAVAALRVVELIFVLGFAALIACFDEVVAFAGGGV